MIIYIDKEGRENIIRSDELIEKLIKENIITENTLLKTEVAGDWIVASEFDLFKKHNKIIEKIDDTPELMKEMQYDYNEALKDPLKINLFKEKWKVVSVIISDEHSSKIKKSDEKFSTSNVWMVIINNKIIILLGRNVHSNLAAFLADNNRGIKENLSDLFEIQDSRELHIIKNPLIEIKDNQISIINKGTLGVPKLKKNVQDNKNDNNSKKTKGENIDKVIEDKFYVPKKTNKKIETINKTNSIKNENKKQELNKSVPSSKNNETDTNKSSITSYKRVKPNKIKVLQFFLYALMLSSLVMLVADINLYNLLNQFNDPTYVPPSNIDTIADNADNYVSIASFINIGILIIAYFFGGRWIYKSNLNLQNISSNKLRFSPGWSVGWYFIPIFSIWKPYQAMKEIYLTSQRIANPNKSPILPGSFIIWWLLWLIGNYLGWYYFRQSLTIDSMSLQEIINLSLIAIVFDIIDVITIFMFLNIVKNINHFEQKIFN